jgi:hypothetical protein
MVQPRVPGMGYTVDENSVRDDVIAQAQGRIDDRVKVLVGKGKSEGEARAQAESEIKEYIDNEIDRRLKWDCQEYANSPCHSADIE